MCWPVSRVASGSTYESISHIVDNPLLFMLNCLNLNFE
jgi:hypothetical protein